MDVTYLKNNPKYFFGAIVVPCGDEIWCWDGMHGNFWIYDTVKHKTRY